MGVSGIFLKSRRAKSLLLSVLKSLTCSWEVSAYHDTSTHSFLTSSVCLLMMGSECVRGLGEGSKFSVSQRATKLNFRAFSSRRSSLTQPFVESCVDIEVAHLSILMIRRLPYPEIPTLSIQKKFCFYHR